MTNRIWILAESEESLVLTDHLKIAPSGNCMYNVRALASNGDYITVYTSASKTECMQYISNIFTGITKESNDENC